MASVNKNVKRVLDLLEKALHKHNVEFTTEQWYCCTNIVRQHQGCEALTARRIVWMIRNTDCFFDLMEWDNPELCSNLFDCSWNEIVSNAVWDRVLKNQ